jgi:hypothetical protein
MNSAAIRESFQEKKLLDQCSDGIVSKLSPMLHSKSSNHWMCTQCFECTLYEYALVEIEVEILARSDLVTPLFFVETNWTSTTIKLLFIEVHILVTRDASSYLHTPGEFLTSSALLRCM